MVLTASINKDDNGYFSWFISDGYRNIISSGRTPTAETAVDAAARAMKAALKG